MRPHGVLQTDPICIRLEGTKQEEILDIAILPMMGVPCDDEVHGGVTPTSQRWGTSQKANDAKSRDQRTQQRINENKKRKEKTKKTPNNEPTNQRDNEPTTQSQSYIDTMWRAPESCIVPPPSSASERMVLPLHMSEWSPHVPVACGSIAMPTVVPPGYERPVANDPSLTKSGSQLGKHPRSHSISHTGEQSTTASQGRFIVPRCPVYESTVAYHRTPDRSASPAGRYPNTRKGTNGKQ